MLKKRYSGKNIDQCLKLASEDLGIRKESINNYNILNENKGFFRKQCEIEVIIDEDKESGSKNNEDLYEVEEENIKNQLVIVEDNKISLSTNEDEIYLLKFDNDINVFVNEEEVKSGVRVSSKDLISYKCNDINGQREFNIKCTDTEARVSTTYTPSLISKVKANISDSTLNLHLVYEESDDIPFYTREEVLKNLSDRNITFGISDLGINMICSKKGVSDVLVAKGIEPIDDEDDEIKVLFEEDKKEVQEDSLSKVDYRNNNELVDVERNQVIGELIVGKEGRDGFDIYGNTINRKLKNCLQLKAGIGCTIKENKVVATTQGQPSIKSGVFNVYKVLEVNTDVDMKSGNIKFVGDVKVLKDVKEGMRIEAGNSLEVCGNIERASIIAQGESILRGSIINSDINIGAKEIESQKLIEDLEFFEKEINSVINYLHELMHKNLLDHNNIGKVVKVLLENKCKNLPKKSLPILQYSEGERIEEIKFFIKTKILGLGPLYIKSIQELFTIKQMVEDEISEKKEKLLVPVDLHINYVQDSIIKVTGNLYIDGKGQYTSKINVLGDIIFTRSSAVCRGGELVAKGNIQAKILGSSAGVSSILRVPKDKIITADRAYNNTTFYFGERKYTLETPSRNLKAFIDSKGEVVIERLLL